MSSDDLVAARDALGRIKASAIENGGRLTPGAILDVQTAIDALAAKPEPGLDVETSCLGCGLIREPSTWDATSHAFLCVECVFAIRWTPALDELVDAALEVNRDHTETMRFAQALDPFRYCYPVPESYHGPFADDMPCGTKSLYLGRSRAARLSDEGAEG